MINTNKRINDIFKRIYNRELDIIKSQVHYYKILNNRYNKLVNRYNQKYGL